MTSALSVVSIHILWNNRPRSTTTRLYWLVSSAVYLPSLLEKEFHSSDGNRVEQCLSKRIKWWHALHFIIIRCFASGWNNLSLHYQKFITQSSHKAEKGVEKFNSFGYHRKIPYEFESPVLFGSSNLTEANSFFFFITLQLFGKKETCSEQSMIEGYETILRVSIVNSLYE